MAVNPGTCEDPLEGPARRYDSFEEPEKIKLTFGEERHAVAPEVRVGKPRSLSSKRWTTRPVSSLDQETRSVQDIPRVRPELTSPLVEEVLRRLDAAAEAQVGFEARLSDRLSTLEAANHQVLQAFMGPADSYQSEKKSSQPKRPPLTKGTNPASSLRMLKQSTSGLSTIPSLSQSDPSYPLVTSSMQSPSSPVSMVKLPELPSDTLPMLPSTSSLSPLVAARGISAPSLDQLNSDQLNSSLQWEDPGSAGKSGNSSDSDAKSVKFRAARTSDLAPVPDASEVDSSRSLRGSALRVSLILSLERVFKVLKTKSFVACTADKPKMEASDRSLDLETMLGAPNAPTWTYSRYTLSPDSRLRSFFDILCCFIVMWDALTIPFVMAWQPDLKIIKLGMIITAIYWMVDIVLSFFTGYYHEGELEMRLHNIVRRYLRGWFWVDITLVLLDWSSVILEMATTSDVSNTDGLSVLRMGKVYRFARIVAWIRLSKAWARLEHLSSMFYAEKWQIIGQLGKLFMFIMWLNHVLCCMWYAAADTRMNDTGVTWLDDVEDSPEGKKSYGDQSMIYQYTTAYHWALTQMTPGSMQVVPRNSVERVLNIITLLVGLLFVTSIVSRMSAKMVQLQMLKQEQLSKMNSLRRYLKEQGIEALVSHRIYTYVQQQLSIKQPLLEEDVHVLSLLTPSLKAAMRHSMFEPYLMKNPFLRLWEVFDAGMVQDLCQGTELKTFAEGAEIFAPRTKTDRVFIVMKGLVRYMVDTTPYDPDMASARSTCSSKKRSEYGLFSCVNSTMTSNTLPGLPAEDSSNSADFSLPKRSSEEHDDPHQDVGQGTWISEGAFWTKWYTKGNCDSASRCELIYVDVTRVRKVLRKHRFITKFWGICSQAWKEYMKHELENFSDLPLDAEHEKVLMHMPVDARIFVAKPVFEGVHRHDWSRWMAGIKRVEDLEAELAEGKCAFLLDAEGSPERIVRLVALKISRPDERFLVQLAEIEDGDLKPLCQLPGKKMSTGTPHILVDQMLREHLSPLINGAFRVGCCTTTVESNLSPTYGMNTRYIRTCLDVSINEPHDFSGRGSESPPEGVFVLRCEKDGIENIHKSGTHTGSSHLTIAPHTTHAPSTCQASQASKRFAASFSRKWHFTDSKGSDQSSPGAGGHEFPQEAFVIPRKNSKPGTPSSSFLEESVKVYAWVHPPQFEQLSSDAEVLKCCVDRFRANMPKKDRMSNW